MLETIKRGIPRYNFLGIQGGLRRLSGVLRFKQNFNGYIVRKMGTFRYYPSPLKYKLISLIKKLLGTFPIKDQLCSWSFLKKDEKSLAFYVLFNKSQKQ